MKDQTIITLAILSLFAIPAANADTSRWASDWREHTSSTRIDPATATESASVTTSTTTVVGEHAQAAGLLTSMKPDSAPKTESAVVKTEAATVTEAASDTPVYADALKKDEIIEKHKHHVLLSTTKRRPWL